MSWGEQIFFMTFLASSIALGDLSGDPVTLFPKCGKLYESNDFQQAIECYSPLTTVLPYQPEVHFNLGNSYYRMNRIGESLFHYRLAQSYLPRDYDIRANLDFVRNKVQEKSDTNESLSSLIQNALSWITLRELGVTAVILWLTSWLLASCRLFFIKMRSAFWSFFINGSFTLFIILSLGLGAKLFWESPFGVVIKNSAPVYSGAGFDNILLFNLNSGVEFNVIDSITTEKGIWLRIRVSEKLEGWIQADNVISVTENSG